MRSKLNFLINMSLKKKIKTKWFLVANIIIALIMLAVINIDSIITLFGGDFDTKNHFVFIFFLKLILIKKFNLLLIRLTYF